MTGWRIGYAVATEPWMTGLSKATLYSSNGVSTPTQWAALAAFTTPSDFLETSRVAYRERRDLPGASRSGMNPGLTRAACRGLTCFPGCHQHQPGQPRSSRAVAQPGPGCHRARRGLRSPGRRPRTFFIFHFDRNDRSRP